MNAQNTLVAQAGPTIAQLQSALDQASANVQDPIEAAYFATVFTLQATYDLAYKAYATTVTTALTAA